MGLQSWTHKLCAVWDCTKTGGNLLQGLLSHSELEAGVRRRVLRQLVLQHNVDPFFWRDNEGKTPIMTALSGKECFGGEKLRLLETLLCDEFLLHVPFEGLFKGVGGDSSRRSRGYGTMSLQNFKLKQTPTGRKLFLEKTIRDSPHFPPTTEQNSSWQPASPSQHAFWTTQQTLLRYRRKAVLEQTDRLGRTPLFHACASLDLGCVRFLLACGARTDVIDNFGETCLYSALAGNCADGTTSRGSSFPPPLGGEKTNAKLRILRLLLAKDKSLALKPEVVAYCRKTFLTEAKLLESALRVEEKVLLERRRAWTGETTTTMPRCAEAVEKELRGGVQRKVLEWFGGEGRRKVGVGSSSPPRSNMDRQFSAGAASGVGGVGGQTVPKGAASGVGGVGGQTVPKPTAGRKPHPVEAGVVSSSPACGGVLNGVGRFILQLLDGGLRRYGAGLRAPDTGAGLHCSPYRQSFLPFSTHVLHTIIMLHTHIHPLYV